MNKLNLLVHLNGYQDTNASNNPSQNNFKWQRDLQGVNISEPASKSLSLPAGQSISLFTGSVSTSADNSTAWNIALKAGTSQTYVISKASGTSPAFRAARTSGADATTQITVTKNANLLTFASVGGTALNLITGGVTVTDEVRIGSLFNPTNQGKFKILARNSTSFTIENPSGQVEGPITLTSDFANQIMIFGSNGVQVGDKVDLIAGFSLVSLGTYDITDVSPDSIEIYSINALPTESAISNNPSALMVYRDAKNFVYVESDQSLTIQIDGSSAPNKLEPMTAGSTLVPGVFMSSASMKSLIVTNTSLETATIFYITAE